MINVITCSIHNSRILVLLVRLSAFTMIWFLVGSLKKAYYASFKKITFSDSRYSLKPGVFNLRFISLKLYKCEDSDSLFELKFS